MIEFRRSLSSDGAHAVRDFKLNAAYAPTAKKNDIVKLDAAGEVVLAVTNDTAVLGVYEGPNIKIAADTTNTGKVRTADDDVYEIDYTGGTPLADNGAGYPVTIGGTGAVLNAAVRTTPLFKAIGVAANGKVEVVIIGRQLI